MDLQALLVFVGGFAVCCGFVFLVSFLGAKEQTFEEALAAQRKKNEKEKAKGKKEKKDQGDKKSKPWRKSKRERGDEKMDLLDDGEEEQVIVVPSPVIQEPMPVEEPTPEESPLPTPEPTPEPVKTKKERKKDEKKKRMAIEEVQEIVEEQIEVEPVAEQPVTKEASPVLEEKIEVVEPVVEQEMVEEIVAPAPVVAPKPSPVKQPKTKKNKGESASGSNPKDLLAVIKKTAFSDSEAQQLIDVLLTKQSGELLNNSEEWIEKGKPTESQKLRQQLNEMEKMLEEEQMKGKSFQDKMAALRVELNQEKSAKASHTRIVEELNSRHGQEVGLLNGKVQGFLTENSMLKGQLNTLQLQMRDTEAMRVQYQATIDNLSGQLQIASTAAVTASANDPHILSELEQLRALRDKYEMTIADLSSTNNSLTGQLSSNAEELGDLKSQVSLKNDEVMGLRNQVNAEQSKLGGVQALLATKTEESKTLTAELARVNNLAESLKQQKASSSEGKAAEAAELEKLKGKLADKEVEVGRLAEENERLSEQLASSVERPAAEGEEAGAAGLRNILEKKAENHNGVPEGEEAAKAAANAKLAEEWREKFDSLTAEHNKMLSKQKALESDYDKQLSSSKTELEALKSKNNELSESLEKSSALMLRLFPNCLSADMSLSVMETKAGQFIQGLNNRLKALHTQALSLAKQQQNLSSSQAEDKSEELEKLEGQVSHYKSVLNQTETMLNALQASVEAAEAEWRSKLESAHRELTSVRSENSNLLSRVHATKDTEEMQGRLEELEKKLEGEQKEKAQLKEKNTNLNQELEKEKKERSDLSQSVESLEASKSELSVSNTKLQQLLTTTKEALVKESEIVKSMQMDQSVMDTSTMDQASSKAASGVKDESEPVSPPAANEVSESSSGHSLDSATSPETTSISSSKKKSKKKKV